MAIVICPLAQSHCYTSGCATLWIHLNVEKFWTSEKTGRVVANGESPRPLVLRILKCLKNNRRTHLLKNRFTSAVVRLIKKNRNPKMKKQTLRTILSRWIRREAGDQISKLEWQISISKCCFLSRQVRRLENVEKKCQNYFLSPNNFKTTLATPEEFSKQKMSKEVETMINGELFK